MNDPKESKASDMVFGYVVGMAMWMVIIAICIPFVLERSARINFSKGMENGYEKALTEAYEMKYAEPVLDTETGKFKLIWIKPTE
jgi:hypothetical protein